VGPLQMSALVVKLGSGTLIWMSTAQLPGEVMGTDTLARMLVPVHFAASICVHTDVTIWLAHGVTPARHPLLLVLA
jgi:hypothetical protein